MSFRIANRAALDREMIRVIRAQVAEAAKKAGGQKLPLTERIHVARSSCKKVRAALRLIRRHDPGLYQRENACFRDAARMLAHYRDDDVMISCLEDLEASKPLPPAVRKFFAAEQAGLEAKRKVEHSDAGTLGPDLDQFVRHMHTALRRLARHKLDRIAFRVVTDGYAETYRKARRAMPAPRSTAAAQFHEWRKWTKMCGYQSRLLRDAWPAVMKARSKAYAELGDVLGAEHDLTVLREFLKTRVNSAEDQAPESIGLRLVDERRRELRRRAIELGRRLFADKPRATGKHLKLFWNATLATGKSPIEPHEIVAGASD
jgi:CHAD domain-containing protein